jgi:hypothetical protein
MPQNVTWHGNASTDEICVPQFKWLIAILSWQRSGFDSRAVCHVGFLMEWHCRSNLAFPYQQLSTSSLYLGLSHLSVMLCDLSNVSVTK